jgi:hypothetical protein
MTLRICARLEMFAPKNTTPAASPALILRSNVAGGVSPR